MAVYPEMTARQLEIFQWIEDFFLDRDKIPSAMDMQNVFDFKSPNTFTTYMKSFTAKGLLEKRGCYYRFSRTWDGRHSMAARRMNKGG